MSNKKMNNQNCQENMQVTLFELFQYFKVNNPTRIRLAKSR